jgi:DNA-binding transcriptional LysR family regulator
LRLTAYQNLMSNLGPSWDLIATYLAVRQTGSLSGAARKLGLSQPTVRRQVETLERAIGTLLFTRSAAGLTPVAGTDGLTELASAMQATADTFVRRATGAVDDLTGRVRISCSEIFAVEILPPILARLRARAPGIVVELSVTNETEDLLRREADVAVRLTAPNQAALVAQKVAAIPVGLYAAPGPFSDLADGKDYAAIQRDLPFVGEDKSTMIEAGLRAAGLDSPANVVFRSDNQLAQLAAVRAGIGIGPCQVQIAERSGLIAVCPMLSFRMEAWVVMHEDLRQFAPVRAVFSHLVNELR